MALGATLVSGDPAAIARTQRSSTHYFQRPDLTYSRLDPTRDSLAGYSLRTQYRLVPPLPACLGHDYKTHHCAHHE
jgi:hypothetical protein